jgi:caffeoyl-CoA O-methyltransferase
MSETSTRVTDRHFEYLAARTRRDDAFLSDLKSAAHAAGIRPIWIAPEQASLMQILLRATGAREVIEVGTLAGYSAIQMARALPADAQGGRVRTIELDPKHVQFARAWIAKSDVKEKVQVIEGRGADVLPTFASNSADAAFLDADKKSYPVYLEQALRIVRTGGLVLVDNAFAFGQLFEEKPTDSEATAVQAFNEIMAREKCLQSVIVPIGDGLWVGVKL